MAVVQHRAGDESRDFLLFFDLPIDKLLDIRMIHVEADHLGGAAGRAAALDRARTAVTDPKEAHESA